MPLDGYLQDLCLLSEDCLLPFFPNKSELIQNSQPKSASCSLDLTPDTLEMMMLLNQTIVSAEQNAPPTSGQFTDKSHYSFGEKTVASTSARPITSSNRLLVTFEDHPSSISTSRPSTNQSNVSTPSPLFPSNKLETGKVVSSLRPQPLANKVNAASAFLFSAINCKAGEQLSSDKPSTLPHHKENLKAEEQVVLTTSLVNKSTSPFVRPTATTLTLTSLLGEYNPPSVSPQSSLPLQSMANIDKLGSSISTPTSASTPLLGSNPNLKEPQTIKMRQLNLAAEGPSSQTTALALRSTAEVIADLKRTTRHPQETPSGPEKPKDAVLDGFGVALKHTPSLSGKQRTDHPRVAENEEDGHGDDEDDDDDEQPAARPRKITERKRRLNAIADNYLQEQLRNSAEEVQVKPENEDIQSAKWLVNQFENRDIISTPREYQVELFERAKEKNIIAVLDTGSGKTLIAVLLLRHIFAQELEDRALGKPKRLSIFLVDSVTLAFQQHAVLKANLDQPMDMFCGEMGTKLWNQNKWEKNFNDNMVIICTAEVFRHCLHHSFISIDRINLLIFDEAHHAKKDHPYARIIKDFYAQAPDKALLPKIFGMTASPVDARVDPRKAAAELETILHCEIATAADTSLLQYAATSKIEHLAKYDKLLSKSKTPLFLQIEQLLKPNKVLSKPLTFAYNATKDLGNWCADQIWPFCLNEETTKKLQAKTESRHLANKVSGPLDVLEKQLELLNKARDIVKCHSFEQPDFDSFTKTSKNLSSKVVVLVRYLRERFERHTDDKCIVFVKQRYTANLLAILFSYPNIKTPYLFPGTLVGTSTGEVGNLNTSFREQVLTMMNFRKGTINCLFATSVAEEGLDIPDCNLIIRFDLYDTLTQYIQSRGRARHANSRYVHMHEATNQDHQNKIIEVRMNEAVLKRFCNALPESRKLTGNDFDMDYFLAKEKSHRVYVHPVTRAKLTYKISLTVLANFVDSLPHGLENNLHPEYVVTVQNKQFICEVILPEGAPIRGLVGRPASTKQVAKCSAAFETCLLLIKGKYLDQFLLPTFTKQLPAMRNALLAVDSSKLEAYDMKTKPVSWCAGTFPDKLFLTVLSLDNPESLDRPSQPLALLTRSPMVQFPLFVLHFGTGKHSPVRTTPLTDCMVLSSDQVQLFNTFTLCIFDDLFSKEYESDPSKMPYFLAPLVPGFEIEGAPEALIAWDSLKQVHDHVLEWQDKKWETKLWQTQPDEFFEDKYIVDPYDGSRKLWCKGVAPQYKPLDPVPPNTAPRSGTRKRTDNIMEYSSSLWGKARARRTFDENQRVFEAELIPLRRNLLDEFDDNMEGTPKKCYIVLEALKISPLPTKIVAMAYLFPAIIFRIEAYLIALEACDLLHLNIRPDLALEAVTKDSDNSANHDVEKINFQRGMGNNYERLEFLGDCFLKMATSISLFGVHPDNDEYRYHVDRMLLICNKNLCDNAIKLKLYECIRSQGFNRRAWYPEGLVLKKGKTATAPNHHKLGDKSIADVCEALIGAALLTCHGAGMDTAVRAVTELVSSENHNVTSWSDYYKLYEKPKYQIIAATEMQRNLARQVEKQHTYHFQWPRLLRSAFVHPSYPYLYEHIPSYQRLEFLGDALLDMACVNFLFHNYPGKDPQWLTEHKMAMVSNAFFGCLCVSLDFHRHLLLFNSTYNKQISDYVQEITEARLQAEEEALHAGKSRADYSPDYWTSVRPPPKCLPDIVEAYVGAVFVDSEYDYSQVEKFFDEHIKWYFNDMSIYDTYAKKHPTTFLTTFLQVDMGCMNWAVKCKEIKSIDGSKPTNMAMIIIHDQVVVHSIAENSRLGKTAAAKKALEKLKGLPLMEFRKNYRCDCKPGDGDEATEDFHGTAV